MENLTYEGDNQSKIESFLMVIFSIYNFNMIRVIRESIDGELICFFMLVGIVASWGLFIMKYKTYSFRARFSAAMIQMSVVFFSINVDDISRAIPVFIAVVVFLGLYGIAEIIYITVVTSLVVFVHHAFIIHSVPLETTSEIISVLSQFANILLLEYVVYVWTKRNSEGSRQLIGVIKELTNAEHSKDDFLANVSHEIRTPINTICGMSEIVLKEELPYSIKENIYGIQQAGRNLMSVVSDILDFSELQSGKIELQEESYNIASTINDVINMSMARKNEKNIELIIDCDANIPCGLLGDEKKLRRIIMKLVDNAIKFTDEGGVSIDIGYRKETYGINLVVKISDSGIGMGERSLEKLFTSFNQVDTSRDRQEGGIGLGLAISNALVRKMGGAITVKSKLGKGSTVQFVVPQKVLDERPIASLTNKENINVATYIDLEQFSKPEIRDEYSKTIVHMAEQLRAKCQNCRNFAELQRREKSEKFSHIFISILEYTNETEYFDRLSNETKVIVVLDRVDEKYITNPKILKIYKPFYILSIVSVLNGLEDIRDDEYIRSNGKFTTRDAHILVVDDNKMNLMVIEGLLEDYNIKVTSALSGMEALEKVVTADYDFVFMDHMMPEMDGVETLHRIRQMVGSYYQRVPIVALTANAVAGTREMMMGEGFNDFLEKPVERSVLERVLKRNIPQNKIVQLTSDEGYKVTSTEGNDNSAYKHDEAECHEHNEVRSDECKHNEGENEKSLKRQEPIAGAGIEEILGKEGLEVDKGILYCNGKERYIKVLQGYCESWDDSGALADELFEKQDWKNYTIAVHGIKSAMRSIGATKVSEIARMLEAAGKENKIDYIKEHHEELIMEYKSLFARLREIELICPIRQEDKGNDKRDDEQDNMANIDSHETGDGTKSQVCDNLPEIADEQFDRFIEDMEIAMYSLDGDRLLAIVSELQKYQYNGTALENSFVQVKRKIEMSDYISAVEMAARLRAKLAGKEE